MKKITFLLFLVAITSVAQVKGNGELITENFTIDFIRALELDLYANIILDASIDSEVMFKGESNMIKYIDFEIVDGVLKLQQKEWISPTLPIEIIIGVPEIERVQVNVHKTLSIINLNQDKLVLTAILGKINASGTVSTLNVNTESGTVNASDLITENAIVNMWSDGSAIINVTNSVSGKINTQSKLSLIQEPKNIAREIAQYFKSKSVNNRVNTRYITVRIKNNSLARQHFDVKGPKPGGSYFGYGFPMMPGAVKKERWTIGTKLYKKSILGTRKVVLEIKEGDEEKTLNLFKD